MSIASRRKREKQQRRDEIIKAAENLFFDRGYDDVSMTHIAQEVELSKATIYLYFSNKEELFFAVVLRGTKILNSMILNEVKKEKTGIEKVAAFRRAYYEFTTNYHNYMHIYNYFQSGRFNIANVVNSAFLQEIMALRNERFKIMCTSVEDGIADGSIRPDVDPVEAAILLSSISKGLSEIPYDHERFLEKKGISHAKFVQDAEKLILHMFQNLNQ